LLGVRLPSRRRWLRRFRMYLAALDAGMLIFCLLALGRAGLYALRAVLDLPATAAGLRRMVLAAAPLPQPARRRRPAPAVRAAAAPAAAVAGPPAAPAAAGPAPRTTVARARTAPARRLSAADRAAARRRAQAAFTANPGITGAGLAKAAGVPERTGQKWAGEFRQARHPHLVPAAGGTP